MLEAQNLDFDDGGGEEKEDGKKDDGKNDPEDCRTILPPGKEAWVGKLKCYKNDTHGQHCLTVIPDLVDNNTKSAK